MLPNARRGRPGQLRQARSATLVCAPWRRRDSTWEGHGRGRRAKWRRVGSRLTSKGWRMLVVVRDKEADARAEGARNCTDARHGGDDACAAEANRPWGQTDSCQASRDARLTTCGSKSSSALERYVAVPAAYPGCPGGECPERSDRSRSTDQVRGGLRGLGRESVGSLVSSEVTTQHGAPSPSGAGCNHYMALKPASDDLDTPTSWQGRSGIERATVPIGCATGCQGGWSASHTRGPPRNGFAQVSARACRLVH